MTMHEQDRQDHEAYRAALETKYKSICKGSLIILLKYNIM